MKSMKVMMSIDELIEHMKEKGITFNEMSEAEAKEFLKHNNYYMKLSAYRANYPKCPPGSKREGQYEKLDFAYLKELSSIDKRLRYYVLEMCLDIEHAIRVQLVEAVTEDGEEGIEDGYRIVKEYLKDPDRFSRVKGKGTKYRNVPDAVDSISQEWQYKGNRKSDGFAILRNINYHKSGEYCRDLYNKYYPYFPIWVLVELISFGDLIRLCEFYDDYREFEKESQPSIKSGGSEKKRGNTDQRERILLGSKYMNIIRDLRNASAHSNCLLNQAILPLSGHKQPDCAIVEFVKGIPEVSTESRRKYLNTGFCYNMTVLFFVYRHYLDGKSRLDRFRELQNFLNGRVVMHKEYFQSNTRLCGVYSYLKKVIDKLAEE